MMSNIFWWGTGIPGLAEESDPSLLLSPNYSAFSKPVTWFDLSFVAEGAKTKAWVSEKTWENSSPLIITGQCSSSLDVAWYFYQLGIFPAWSSVLALSQWSGRGRLHRSWYSAAGNLYAAWHLPKPPTPWAEILPMVAGYIIIQGLEKMAEKMAEKSGEKVVEKIKVQLKWPNDLVIGRKKAGGILIEERGGVVMAGVGINLVSKPEKSELRGPETLDATYLKAFGFNFDQLEFWQTLVSIGRICYEKIIFNSSTNRFICLLQPYLAFMDEEIMVNDPSGQGPYPAKIIGLDESGRLCVLNKLGQERVISGGASIHPTDALTGF